jgi:hypothetical protein
VVKDELEDAYYRQTYAEYNNLKCKLLEVVDGIHKVSSRDIESQRFGFKVFDKGEFVSCIPKEDITNVWAEKRKYF